MSFHFELSSIIVWFLPSNSIPLYAFVQRVNAFAHLIAPDLKWFYPNLIKIEKQAYQLAAKG